MSQPINPPSPTTGYTHVPPSPPASKPKNGGGDSTVAARTISTSRKMMVGAIGVLSIFVLVQTYFYTYDSPGDIVAAAHASTSTAVTIGGALYRDSEVEPKHSWMDNIVFHRSSLAGVSHELKRRKQRRDRKNNITTKGHKEKNTKAAAANDANDDIGDYSSMMEDISVLYDAVAQTVRDIGVRGLLFEVLSDDFEYYVYNDESNSSDETGDDDSSSDSVDELHTYWRKCSSKHGVGKDCNEWDVWWTYHYVGIVITDMLLQDNELLWDGSSGEKITAASAGPDDQDTSMATLLDKIHHLQATLPYLTQASFHAQHALIWRYVERSSGRLSSSYPWDVSIRFCRGDGSREKGIVGRPVGKGIDHECFHGFGHAMFYAVAAKQIRQRRHEKQHRRATKSKNKDEGREPFLVLAPHSGFTLSQKSYCEVYELCRGASPTKEERRAMDPNDEARANSYRICFEGVVHSVRLMSEDSKMTHKQSAIDIVDKEMKRCASAKKKKTKKKGHDNERR